MGITNEDYIQQYKQLHEDEADYGTTSAYLFEAVGFLIECLEAETILDYGCGKGRLLKQLQQAFPEKTFYGYDPAIPEYETCPSAPVDLVVNTDVLEHIPEEDVGSVLQHISQRSDHVFFNLHHEKAATILPSGENAHCTVKTPRWYRRTIRKHFDTVQWYPGRRYFSSVLLTFRLSGAQQKQLRQRIRSHYQADPLSARLYYWAKSFIRNYVSEDFSTK